MGRDQLGLAGQGLGLGQHHERSGELQEQVKKSVFLCRLSQEACEVDGGQL